MLGLRWLETVLLGACRLGSNLPVRLKKGTNKNGVALSSGFNILRRSFKSCVQARLSYLVLSGRTENDWNLGDNSLESCPLRCYQRDRQLSRIWSAVSLYSEAVQLNCAREDGDFKTLSSSVKLYKGPRIVAFWPSFFHWLFWPRKPFPRPGRRKKVWHRFRARANFSRTLIRVSEKTFPVRKKTSKNNVDYSERFLLSSHHEIIGKEFKRKN